MLQLLRRLFGRPPKTQLPPFNFARNRYKPKKIWPPQLSELTERQQFRFERKLKRRLLIKSTRPVFVKWVTIVQWSLISFLIVYGIFFYDFANDPMNPRPGEQPFARLRERMWELFGSFWTHTNTASRRPDRGLESGAMAGSEPSKQASEADKRQHVGRNGVGGG